MKFIYISDKNIYTFSKFLNVTILVFNKSRANINWEEIFTL